MLNDKVSNIYSVSDTLNSKKHNTRNAPKDEETRRKTFNLSVNHMLAKIKVWHFVSDTIMYIINILVLDLKHFINNFIRIFFSTAFFRRNSKSLSVYGLQYLKYILSKMVNILRLTRKMVTYMYRDTFDFIREKFARLRIEKSKIKKSINSSSKN